MATKILAACTGGGAGDLFAALPAVSALSRHFGAPVDVLTTTYAAPLIAGQPFVGEVLTDDGRMAEKSLVEVLRTRHYTHAVVFWSNPRIAKAVQLAGIPTRVGQARRLYSFRYTKRVTIRTESGDTQSHWTDVQMDYARALGVQPRPDDYCIDIKLTDADEMEAERLLEQTVGAVPFVIFHAARGISTHAPHWPSEHFAVIADALGAAFSAPVLLTGGANEAQLVAQTAKYMTQPAHNVAGKTTLRGFAALAGRALVVVALDSGPMHIAAAVGAPTVGIFALRTDLPKRWRPLGPRVATVEPDYPCPRSCRKETCRTFACYAALSAQRVVAAARTVAAPSPSEVA
ncbi:MAG: glycosyltransferase family 9 protein [Candidatus Eremiobacteraeota bacterium]|nr:glycosyltransferase family 9 protein [Candidatus Eremiobacteraeota bacterium]